MDKLIVPDVRAEFLHQTVDDAYAEMNKPAPVRRERKQGTRTVQPAKAIPTPPFWGSKTISYMPLEIVLQYLNKQELYRLSWGAGNTHGDAWTKLQAEFDARLDAMSKAAIHEKILRPQAVYGYYPANSDGDDLVIWDPEPFNKANGSAPVLNEIGRFPFPRQPYGEFLCLSDYFAPVDSGQIDTAAFQVVTAGKAASERFEKMQSADQYTDAYFFHGLAVQAAEATANYVNRQVVNKGLNIPGGQGKRYSWGYGACPDLSQHELVLKLLPQASLELGMQLTESFQWIPEQSTAAIVIHHPEAKYFNVGADRVEQIVGEAQG
jgi:5-methyltetrahydrofolate--homocysteine methyltransferase